MSLYERGLKMPSFAVADRIVQAAGYRLDIVTQVKFWPHSSTRVGRYWVPDRLWRGTLPTCFARVDIDDLAAGRPIRYNLRRRSQRRKLYERLIRSGTPEQMMEWIDGALLVDIWDELSIPKAIRETWQPVIVLARNVPAEDWLVYRHRKLFAEGGRFHEEER